MYLKINLRIFLFAVIFCLTGQMEFYGIAMLFAFAHEMGHLIVGVLLGFKVKNLTINPMGLTVRFGINVKEYNKKVKKGNMLALKKIIIASSGPAINFLIVLVAYFLYNKCNLNIDYSKIIYINIIIGIFNLIPIYPLDGGQILKNILHIKCGLENSYKYTNEISNILLIIITAFSSIAIYYLKNIAVLFIIIFLWNLVIKENKIHNQRSDAYKIMCDMEIENKKEIC